MNKKQCITRAVTLTLGVGGGAALLLDGFATPVGSAPPSLPNDAHSERSPLAKQAEPAHEEQEGLLELSAEQITLAGIELAEAQARTMSSAISLPGEIRFDEDSTAHVVPRAAGVVESVQVSLGQRVQQGELLAVIASQQISEQRSEMAAAQRRVELARTTFARERQLC